MAIRQAPKRAWLFKLEAGSPSARRISRRNLGKDFRISVAARSSEIEEGDGAFFWISGEKGGLRAAGEVTLKDEGGGILVRLERYAGFPIPPETFDHNSLPTNVLNGDMRGPIPMDPPEVELMSERLRQARNYCEADTQASTKAADPPRTGAKKAATRPTRKTAKKPQELHKAQQRPGPPLGKELQRLGLRPSQGAQYVFLMCGDLANARRASTRGVLTTRTLLFALIGPQGGLFRYGGKPVIESGLNLDFADLAQDPNRLQKVFHASFRPVKPDLTISGDWDQLDQFGTTPNFRRVLAAAGQIAAAVGRPGELLSEHLAAALLLAPKTRGSLLLEDLGIPAERARDGLIGALKRTKSGDDYERWEMLLRDGLPMEPGAKTDRAEPEAAFVEPLPDEPTDLSEIAARFDESMARILLYARALSDNQIGYRRSTLSSALMAVAMIEFSPLSPDFVDTPGNQVWTTVSELVRRHERTYRDFRNSIVSGRPDPESVDGLLQEMDIARALNLARTAPFEWLIRRADVLARERFKSEAIAPDHLLAAMLEAKDRDIYRVRESLGLAAPGNRAMIWAAVRDRLDRPARDDWADILNVEDKAAEVEEDGGTAPFPDLIAARYAADSPDADDLMDIEEEAQAFARYVAKRKLDTPLAIGLFGDWGSGKTFFMRKMKSFVRDFTKYGRSDRIAGRDSSWCSDIVQIEFNAWHYIESNLWASLVEHIITELDKWLRASKKDDKVIEALFAELETVKTEKGEAEQELERAEAAYNEAQTDLEALQTQLDSVLQRHNRIQATDAWAAINAGFSHLLTKNQKRKKEVSDAAAKLGLDGLTAAVDAAAQIHSTVQQASRTAQRGRLLARSVFAQL